MRNEEACAAEMKCLLICITCNIMAANTYLIQINCLGESPDPYSSLTLYLTGEARYSRKVKIKLCGAHLKVHALHAHGKFQLRKITCRGGRTEHVKTKQE